MFSRLRALINAFCTVQGDKPWSDAHKPLAKRLKLSHPKKGRTLTSGASAASGAQTAGSETSSPSSSASGSDDDSDYDSDSDAAAEKDEPSPLPATRPADPKKAIEYDVIKCVWFKRSAHVTAAAIRTALGDYWNTIKRVRDNWKTEMAALQEAEEKKDDARAERRRSRATEQRNTLENIFRVTLLHGHPDIVEKYVSLFFPSHSFILAVQPVARLILRVRGWLQICKA